MLLERRDPNFDIVEIHQPIFMALTPSGKLLEQGVWLELGDIVGLHKDNDSITVTIDGRFVHVFPRTAR
jgi:hypothetical protein